MEMAAGKLAKNGMDISAVEIGVQYMQIIWIIINYTTWIIVINI